MRKNVLFGLTAAVALGALIIAPGIASAKSGQHGGGRSHVSHQTHSGKVHSGGKVYSGGKVHSQHAYRGHGQRGHGHKFHRNRHFGLYAAVPYDLYDSCWRWQWTPWGYEREWVCY